MGARVGTAAAAAGAERSAGSSDPLGEVQQRCAGSGRSRLRGCCATRGCVRPAAAIRGGLCRSPAGQNGPCPCADTAPEQRSAAGGGGGASVAAVPGRGGGPVRSRGPTAQNGRTPPAPAPHPPGPAGPPPPPALTHGVGQSNAARALLSQGLPHAARPAPAAARRATAADRAPAAAPRRLRAGAGAAGPGRSAQHRPGAGPRGCGSRRGSGCPLPNHRSAPGVGRSGPACAAGAVLLGTRGVGLLQKGLLGERRVVLGTGPPALGGAQHLAGVKSPPPSPHRSPAPSHPRNSHPTSSYSALLQMTPWCPSVPPSSPSLSSLQH